MPELQFAIKGLDTMKNILTNIKDDKMLTVGTYRHEVISIQIPKNKNFSYRTITLFGTDCNTSNYQYYYTMLYYNNLIGIVVQ